MTRIRRAGGARSRSTISSSHRTSPKPRWAPAETAGSRELNLVDPDEGTDLLFEVLTHELGGVGMEVRSARPSPCCAT